MRASGPEEASTHTTTGAPRRSAGASITSSRASLSALRQATATPSRESRSAVTARTDASAVSGPTRVISTPAGAGHFSSEPTCPRTGPAAPTTMKRVRPRRSLKVPSPGDSSRSPELVQPLARDRTVGGAREVAGQARPGLLLRRFFAERLQAARASEQRLLAKRSGPTLREVRVESAQRARRLAEAQQQIPEGDGGDARLIRIGERRAQRSVE